MIFDRIRLLVRLHGIYFNLGISGKPIESLLVVPSLLTIGGLLKDWKRKNSRKIFSGAWGCDLPCELVKSRTQVIKKFTQQHSDDRVHCLELSSSDVPGILSVFLRDNGKGFLRKGVQFPI